MDAKIAPSRPKPSCRLVQTDIPHKSEPLSRYHLANEMKSEVPVIGQHTPPTYQDSFFGQKSTSTDSQLNMLEAQQAAPVIGIKPFKRTNSQESGFFTGGDSDVASNFSVSA